MRLLKELVALLCNIPILGLSFFLIPYRFARDALCCAVCVHATMKESESASPSPISQPPPALAPEVAAVAAVAAGGTSSDTRSGKHTKLWFYFLGSTIAMTRSVLKRSLFVN